MDKNVNNFINKILNTKLVRDDETLFYTLGDAELDKIFTLPNEKPVYTPNSEDVESFANTAYILALLGYKPTNFTSIPAGFLMTVQNGNGQHKTFFINKTMEKFNIEILVDLARETAIQSGTEFHDKLYKSLASGESLRKVCLDCGNYKSADSLSEGQKTTIEDAILEFNSDKYHPNSLNNQNCNNNHKVLERVCRHSLGVDLGETTEEQEQMVKELYDLTLFHWILPGYKAFRGVTADGEITAKAGQILNDRAIEAVERFPDYHDACAVMNMCSTDYVADIAYAIMTVYEKETSLEAKVSEIESVNPATPNNKSDKNEIRQLMAEISTNEKVK